MEIFRLLPEVFRCLFFLSVCLSFCLSACLSAFLSVRLSVYRETKGERGKVLTGKKKPKMKNKNYMRHAWYLRNSEAYDYAIKIFRTIM